MRAPLWSSPRRLQAWCYIGGNLVYTTATDSDCLEVISRDFNLFWLIWLQEEMIGVEKGHDRGWEVRSRRDGSIQEIEVMDSAMVTKSVHVSAQWDL